MNLICRIFGHRLVCRVLGHRIPYVNGGYVGYCGRCSRFYNIGARGKVLDEIPQNDEALTRILRRRLTRGIARGQ